MNAPRWFLPLILLVAALPTTTPASAQSTLRVMSFNVRYPSPTGAHNWPERRDLMVRVIRQQHPDVIGTQELYKKQGDYIVSKLPTYAWFGMGRYGNDGDEHMGVFYRKDRLRVLDSGNFWLSATPDVPASMTWGNVMPRMVTWARFKVIASGRTFVMYDTHLPYRKQDEANRVKCAREIFAHLHKIPPGEPIVLTGDFNTTPDSQVHTILTQMLTDTRVAAPARKGPAKTFQDFTGNPGERIDWILVRGFKPTAAWTVTTHVGDNYPSDHFPIVTDLKWSPAKLHPVNGAH